MTHDPRFPLEDFEEEPIEVEVAANPRAIIEVSFDRDQIRELGREQRDTGVLPTTFIREYTLEAIRAKRREREQGQAEVAD